MDEHVLIPADRPDEPITLGRVEPLDGALMHRHRLSPRLDKKDAAPRSSVPRHKRLPEACSISKSRNAQAERPIPIAKWIATRNLRLSKLLGRERTWGRSASTG